MSNFPTSVSTDANLYVAVNGLQTTLASPALVGDTTLVLTSTTGFPATGAVTVDNNEVVFYTGIGGSSLTGCTRGADGTTALAHNAGVTVGLTVVAAHHNRLKDEVIALETALGAGYANPVFGDLTAGSAKVAVTGGTGAVHGTGSTVDLGTVALDDLSNVTVPSPSTNDILAYNGAAWVNTGAPAASLPLAGGTMTGDITMGNDKAVIFKETTGNGTDAVTLKAPASVTASYTIQLPPAIASAPGQVLTDVAGDGVTSWAGAVGATMYREDYVVGTPLNNYTGSTTVFNLVSAYTVAGKTLIATLDGDIQTLGASVDYLETNPTTVTFNNALVTGQKVSLIFSAPSASSSGVVNSGTSPQLAFYAATGATVSGINASASANNQKITNLANGTASTDAAAFGQVNYLTAPVQTVNSTPFSTTSNTYQTTNLSASITPSATSSRVKITVSGLMTTTEGSGDHDGYLSIFRNSTNLAVGSHAAMFLSYVIPTGGSTRNQIGISFIDSPSTTSATTYSVKVRSGAGGATAAFAGNVDTVMILEEIR